MSDLLEVRYATSLADGTFLDSSGMAKPGTAGDSSLYFVLGEQVAGTGALVACLGVAECGVCLSDTGSISID